MEILVELKEELLKTNEQFCQLLEQLDVRGYPVGELMIENEIEEWEDILELDSKNVFRTFYGNEYEAEKKFTLAALEYYWGKTHKIIHYLYGQRPH